MDSTDLSIDLSTQPMSVRSVTVTLNSTMDHVPKEVESVSANLTTKQMTVQDVHQDIMTFPLARNVIATSMELMAMYVNWKEESVHVRLPSQGSLVELALRDSMDTLTAILATVMEEE
jgi:hypothetical protein